MITDELKALVNDASETDLTQARSRLDAAMRSEQTSPALPKRPWVRWLAVPAVASVLGVAAAAALWSDDGTSGLGSPAEIAALFGGAEVRSAGEGSPADVAQSLAASSKGEGVVATGVIRSFAEGRTYGVGFDYPKDPGIPTVVMEIEVSEVEQGDGSVDAGAPVFVEVPVDPLAQGEKSVASRFTELVPIGTETLVYLEPLGPGGTFPATEISNDGSGVPDGAILYRVFSPQGFYLASPDGVIQPQGAQIYPGSALEELAPDAEAFPDGEIAPAPDSVN